METKATPQQLVKHLERVLKDAQGSAKVSHDLVRKKLRHGLQPNENAHDMRVLEKLLKESVRELAGATAWAYKTPRDTEEAADLVENYIMESLHRAHGKLRGARQLRVYHDLVRMPLRKVNLAWSLAMRVNIGLHRKLLRGGKSVVETKATEKQLLKKMLGALARARNITFNTEDGIEDRVRDGAIEEYLGKDILADLRLQRREISNARIVVHDMLFRSKPLTRHLIFRAVTSIGIAADLAEKAHRRGGGKYGLQYNRSVLQVTKRLVKATAMMLYNRIRMPHPLAKGVGSTKPYGVVSRGDKWYVHKLEGGRPAGDALGTHESEAGAERQRRALYAQEVKRMKSQALTRKSRASTKKRPRDPQKVAGHLRKIRFLMTDATKLYAGIPDLGPMTQRIHRNVRSVAKVWDDATKWQRMFERMKGASYKIRLGPLEVYWSRLSGPQLRQRMLALRRVAKAGPKAKDMLEKARRGLNNLGRQDIGVPQGTGNRLSPAIADFVRLSAEAKEEANALHKKLKERGAA